MTTRISFSSIFISFVVLAALAVGSFTSVARADSAACGVFVRALAVGSTDATTGGEVTRLQTLLAANAAIYPEGLITGYYGSLTAKAVVRWQAAHGIAQLGIVGPMTRASFVCSASTPVPPTTPTPPVTPAPPATTTPTQPATTTPVATTPSCMLSTDKETYYFNDQTVISWTSTNADYVTFTQSTASGVLQLPVLGTYTAKGSITVHANVSGTPVITLKATGASGVGVCTKTITVRNP